MKKRVLKAISPAKLNLTFEIINQLPNGYHNIETLYQTINLEDELTFEIQENNEVDLEIVSANRIPIERFPLDEANLVSKATKLFLSSLPEAKGIKLKASVHKNIPSAAGLAGGSSNAAATLLMLNYFFKNPFGFDELMILAAKLGADVPFCLQGGTCIGHGLGDNLKTINNPVPMHFLLVKPKNIFIDTSWAYSAYDELEDNTVTWNIKKAISFISTGDIKQAAQYFGNSFESLVFDHFPILSKIKEILLSLGCLPCHLTGKGPTLYAPVLSLEDAHKIKKQFLEESVAYKEDKMELDCWVANSTSYGVHLVDEL